MKFEMTRQQALEQGLLVCGNCGYPENNHFGHTGACAHDKNCKAYREVARVGKLLKEKEMKKSLALVLVLSLLFVGCFGYTSKENEAIGQVKKVYHNTPMICPDYVAVDISLGVMIQGVGSLSTQDIWLVIRDHDKASLDVAKAAANNGQLVKFRYNKKRAGGDYWVCTEENILTHIEFLK